MKVISMKSVLVTGGAGFIGSHLTEELVNRGYGVTVLDNISIGKESNLQNIINKIKFVKGDVRDKDLVDSLVKGKNYIVHLAAVSSSQMFVPSPREGYEVNLLAFINFLDSALRYKVKNIVFASTSSLYSKIKPPHKETAIVRPGSFYEATKQGMEDLARIYGELFGLQSVGLRFFAVYGPNEIHKGKFANIVSQFTWDIIKDRQPVLWGDGKQTRDFIYVMDLVDGIIKAMESNYTGILNMGTGKSYTLNELVEIINKKLGKNIKPKYVDFPFKNYVMYNLADISLARDKIGFNPKVSLEKGVENLINFYKENNIKFN